MCNIMFQMVDLKYELMSTWVVKFEAKHWLGSRVELLKPSKQGIYVLTQFFTNVITNTQQANNTNTFFASLKSLSLRDWEFNGLLLQMTDGLIGLSLNGEKERGEKKIKRISYA